MTGATENEGLIDPSDGADPVQVGVDQEVLTRREDRRVRLYRNRDFVLLQSGQLVSSLGSSLTTIAYPLLALELTHSPAKAGLVVFARYLPEPLIGLVAGVAADRLDRRRLMIASDVVRAVAIGTLAVLIAWHPLFWPIPLLAFIEGSAATFFEACMIGALRGAVAEDQLPSAVSVQQGRLAAAELVGPPLGGALFGIARLVPFAVDAASHVFSFVSLILVRTPFQHPREHTPLRLRTEVAEGLVFLWRQPFLRVTTLFFAVDNFAIPGTLFLLVVVGRRQGLDGAEIGLLLALFSAALLVGAAVSGAARSRMSVGAIIRMEQYCGVVCAAYLVWPSVYVLAFTLVPLGLAMIITDSVVIPRRIALTPDALLGRVESARTTIARVALPLGPLVAGLLLSALSPRQSAAFFVCCFAALAVWATFSRAIDP